MKVFTTDDVYIPHADLLRLRSAGKVRLGIGQLVAEKISSSSNLKPTKTTAAHAFTFWSWVAAGGLFYSIYLSFTSNWWWFIVGIIGGSVVHNANKSANQTNLLDAAMVDEQFYEKIVHVGGWQYAMSEEDAASFFTPDYRIGQALVGDFKTALAGNTPSR